MLDAAVGADVSGIAIDGGTDVGVNAGAAHATSAMIQSASVQSEMFFVFI
jgi:hypothetical protein